MMNTKLSQILMMLFLIVIGYGAIAQKPGNPGFPFKALESQVYSTDILIQGNPNEDQRNAKIVVAPNGFLYAAYIISSGGYKLARSVNGGATWTHSSLLNTGYYITAVDLAVTGADTTTMNVWAISSGYNKGSIDVCAVSLAKFNQHMSGKVETPIDNMISNYGFPDVAIATDFAFPSSGSSPFSIGILYSKIGAANDDVIFKSSADGGTTFSNTQILASTGHYYVNVALAFGRSAALPQGRYFAAWDKQPMFSYYGSYYGKIYTAHSNTQFNSSWSVPAQLDAIGGGFTNGAKNPSIACQADLQNNSSNAFSAVVMYDKMLTANGSNTCVYGVGNANPVAGDVWSTVFSTGTGNIKDMESDVTYDPSNHKFYTTWCDSLNAKLKCAVDGMNLTTGGTWTNVSDGYNDAASIANPYPKVKFNAGTMELVHVWDGQRDAFTANATFDKSFFGVGIPDAASPSLFSFSISPNPCQAQSKLSFNLDCEELVSASIYDLAGRMVLSVPSEFLSSGNHSILLNTSNLVPACYVVKFLAGKKVGFQRLIVIP